MSSILVHVPMVSSKLLAKLALSIPACLLVIILVKPRLLLALLVTTKSPIQTTTLNATVLGNLWNAALASIAQLSMDLIQIPVFVEGLFSSSKSKRLKAQKNRGRKGSIHSSTSLSKKQHSGSFKMVHDLPYDVLLPVFGLDTKIINVHPAPRECWNSFLTRLENSGNNEYKETAAYLRIYFKLLAYPTSRPAMRENNYSGTELDMKLAVIMFFENFGIHPTGPGVEPLRQSVDDYMRKLSGTIPPRDRTLHQRVKGSNHHRVHNRQ
ncbi:SubName: Full=Uncharacterized protein {ECO:0000313/EMBL:CCA67545.1} [Serendipita indica DSM 11827]|nr:SubName: Full=Uncharacterized protein {ECO:0000313/EMBL:CCA67545.1} [Serendipita indica DSM 11827]